MFAVAVLVVGLWLPLPDAAVKPGAPVIMGTQRSSFRLIPATTGMPFPGYRNNGYRQTVEPGEAGYLIRIETVNGQISSKLKGRRVTLRPVLAPLAEALNANHEEYLADQVTYMFEWLRREIQYETEWVADQTIEKVMRTRSANCVGLSSVAIEVLAAMGVRARYVTGIAFQRQDKAKLVLEGSVLHRWIEIHYEDAGWVFADPSGKVNFVEATYLVMGVDSVHPLEELKERAVGSSVELLKLENGFRVIGRIPGVDGRLRIRPNRLFVNP